MKSATGYCNAWGSDKNARCVFGLSKAEKEAIRRGELVTIEGPLNRGQTIRKVIEHKGRFYARLP